MRLSSILLCSIGFWVASCHQTPEAIAPALAHADSLMDDHPDSALHYLQSLDLSGLSDADKAYYGLQLAQASDKNFLPLLPCDSLVNAALDYYDEGDGLLRAKALLYKSRIQQSMNMPQEAMENCFAGLNELGDTRQELRLKSMLYEDLGGIYLSQFVENKAVEMFKQSYCCDSLLGDEGFLKYSIANIGWVHVILDHESVAKLYLDRALEMALKQNDSQFVSDIYSKLSVNSENVDSAFMYIRLAQAYQTDKVDSISLFLSLGELFLEKNQLDSADCYLKKLLGSSDFKKQVLGYRLLSDIEKEKGNYQRAYNYSMFYQDNVDSIFSLSKMSEIERLAYKYEAENAIFKAKVKTESTILFIVSISIILLLLLLLIIQRIHRRKKIAKLVFEQTISHLNKQIELQQSNIEHSKKELLLLQQAQQQNDEEIAQKEQDIRKMIDEKAQLRNWFFMQTPIYKRIDELAQQGNAGKEAHILLQSEQQLLKETAFQIYDEYVQYLQTTYPKLTEDDCLYCCLQLCRLDDQTIAYCFGNTGKQIVAQRRLRLKKKMENF